MSRLCQARGNRIVDNQSGYFLLARVRNDVMVNVLHETADDAAEWVAAIAQAAASSAPLATGEVERPPAVSVTLS